MLSGAKPRPVSDLTTRLNTVMQLERSARPLPCGATSEVIGYWLQRTVDAFQPVSLGDLSLRELGRRLEERIQAWRIYETKLNEAVVRLCSNSPWGLNPLGIFEPVVLEHRG